MTTKLVALSTLALALGCASVRHQGGEPALDDDGADAPPTVVAADAVAPVTWNIPVEQQPPLLDGAAQVLTSVARDRFVWAVGRFLQGSPSVYQGTLSVDAGALGALPSSQVTLTSTIFPNLYHRGLTLEQTHVMRLRDADGAQVLSIFQETSEAELDPEWLSPQGHGSAWLDVSMPDAPQAVVWGRCFECMTVVDRTPGQRLELRVETLDLEGSPPQPVRVEAELEHVPPELLTPELFERATHADGTGLAIDPREFVEREPGLWQYEHVDRTYLRCKQGGSRMVDFRTTWTLEQGAPERSGIGPIEVFRAAECEDFDYGGGS